MRSGLSGSRTDAGGDALAPPPARRDQSTEIVLGRGRCRARRRDRVSPGALTTVGLAEPKRRGLVGEPSAPPRSLAASKAADVVGETDEHQHQEESDSDCRDPLVDLPPDGAATEAFDHGEQDVTP